MPMHADDTARADAASTGLDATLPKDLAACGIVFGVASFAWFGWAQAAASTLLGVLLGIGAVLGLVLAAVSVVRRRGLPGPGRHEVDTRHANRVYATWVTAEFVLIIAGNIALGRTGHPDYIVVWTYAVMAAHFVPLARLYRIRLLDATTALGLVVAALGIVLHLTLGWATTSVVGGLGGLLLLVSGTLCLRQALTAART